MMSFSNEQEPTISFTVNYKAATVPLFCSLVIPYNYTLFEPSIIEADMSNPVSIALAGIGGYGKNYVNTILTEGEAHNVQLAGVIDPFAEQSPFLAEFQQHDVPIYDGLTAFFANHKVDLVALSTPIHLHAPQTIQCLEKGASVFCEKPLCVTIQEARQMAEAEAQNPGFVGIGYQWSFSNAIQALKQDIITGKLGKPKLLKSSIFWPRPVAYYQRNNWAARIKTDDGIWVLDSPANNATAHYIHNMVYVLGATRETSAQLSSVQAELYRANQIENYDTVALRAFTTEGVEMLFYATHASRNNINPIFDYYFEDATVTFATDGSSEIEAHFKDGMHKNYGNPFAEGMGKLWQAVDALRTGDRLACGIEASMVQTRCINGAQESPEAIIDFPKNLLHTIDGQLTYVENLEENLTRCYTTNTLPSEHNDISWARAGRVVDLTHYDHFPMREFD